MPDRSEVSAEVCRALWKSVATELLAEGARRGLLETEDAEAVARRLLQTFGSTHGQEVSGRDLLAHLASDRQVTLSTDDDFLAEELAAYVDRAPWPTDEALDRACEDDSDEPRAAVQALLSRAVRGRPIGLSGEPRAVAPQWRSRVLGPPWWHLAHGFLTSALEAELLSLSDDVAVLELSTWLGTTLSQRGHPSKWSMEDLVDLLLEQSTVDDVHATNDELEQHFQWKYGFWPPARWLEQLEALARGELPQGGLHHGHLMTAWLTLARRRAMLAVRETDDVSAVVVDLAAAPEGLGLPHREGFLHVALGAQPTVTFSTERPEGWCPAWRLDGFELPSCLENVTPEPLLPDEAAQLRTRHRARIEPWLDDKLLTPSPGLKLGGWPARSSAQRDVEHGQLVAQLFLDDAGRLAARGGRPLFVFQARDDARRVTHRVDPVE